MQRLSSYLVVVASCAALAAVGCDDDDTGGGGTGGTTSQGGGGTGGAPGGSGGEGGGGGDTVSLDVTVVEFNGVTRIEGAGVAVDLSDSSRVEGVTDAQGEATLELPAGATIDFLIAHKDGYSFNGFAGSVLGTALQANFWLMAAEDTTSMLAVTGTATNMANPGTDYLQVAASAGTSFLEEGATAYDILVEPSMDFTLLAMDIGLPVISGQDVTRVFHSVVISEQTAITSAAVVDIDFATPTPSTTTFTTSLVLPADTVLATTGVAGINASTPNLWSGGTTTCTKNTTAFDCTGEIWDVGAAITGSYYFVVTPEGMTSNYGRSVGAVSSSGPSVGTVDMQFPNPPDLTSPSGAGPHPVDTPVQYTVAAGGGDYDVVAVNINAEDGRLIGIAQPDQTAGEITIPALPSTSDPGTLYESSMTFQIFTCRSGSGGYCAATGNESWEATPPAN